VGKGAEKLKDIFGVDSQFHGAMREGTQDCGEGGIPGNGPVTVGLDMFRGFTSANGEIKVSDRGCRLIFGEGGEKSREDDVKVDRRPCKDMFPLRFRERWEDTGGLERPEGMFKVRGVILDHAPGVLEILRERGRGEKLLHLPGVERLVDFVSLGGG
jgi:hypothetical protein